MFIFVSYIYILFCQIKTTKKRNWDDELINLTWVFGAFHHHLYLQCFIHSCCTPAPSHQTNSYNVQLTLWLHAFFQAWQRIAATKYCLYPTSYAHISKNYVKQYKCSAHQLPACSVYMLSLTWRFCMSRQKPSQLLKRFYKKKKTCWVVTIVYRQLCRLAHQLLYAKWWPWLMTWRFIKTAQWGNTTVLIFSFN